MSKSKRARRYTAKQVIKAIPGTGGMISAIAEKLDCDWHTAKRWVTTSETVRRAYLDERERVVDLAESVLLRSIRDGNTQDAKWYLERMRKEQYSLRREILLDSSDLLDMSLDELDELLADD